MLSVQCIGCGCSDFNACVKDGEACHWLKVDNVMQIGVCSNCHGYIEELERRQAELAKFAGQLHR